MQEQYECIYACNGSLHAVRVSLLFAALFQQPRYTGSSFVQLTAELCLHEQHNTLLQLDLLLHQHFLRMLQLLLLSCSTGGFFVLKFLQVVDDRDVQRAAGAPGYFLASFQVFQSDSKQVTTGAWICVRLQLLAPCHILNLYLIVRHVGSKVGVAASGAHHLALGTTQSLSARQMIMTNN